jgi:hypothetical protein
MDMSAATTQFVYVGTAYMLAYLLYLLMKGVSADGRAFYPAAPYDTDHLVLRRRYV